MEQLSFLIKIISLPQEINDLSSPSWLCADRLSLNHNKNELTGYFQFLLSFFLWFCLKYTFGFDLLQKFPVQFGVERQRVRFWDLKPKQIFHYFLQYFQLNLGVRGQSVKISDTTQTFISEEIQRSSHLDGCMSLFWNCQSILLTVRKSVSHYLK